MTTTTTTTTMTTMTVIIKMEALASRKRPRGPIYKRELRQTPFKETMTILLERKEEAERAMRIARKNEWAALAAPKEKERELSFEEAMGLMGVRAL